MTGAMIGSVDISTRIAPDRKARAAFVNSLIGRPYKVGAQGPEVFDCWSLTRHVQRHLYGRELPAFQAPDDAGLQAIAGFIAGHPERRRWRPVPCAIDGALVSMFRMGIGHHIGTFLDLDGGLVLHALPACGVTVDEPFRLMAPPDCWTRLRFYLPND